MNIFAKWGDHARSSKFGIGTFVNSEHLQKGDVHILYLNKYHKWARYLDSIHRNDGN